MQSSFLTLALSLSFITASLAPNALWATGKPIAALYETSYTNSDGLVVERGAAMKLKLSASVKNELCIIVP